MLKSNSVPKAGRQPWPALKDVLANLEWPKHTPVQNSRMTSCAQKIRLHTWPQLSVPSVHSNCIKVVTAGGLEALVHSRSQIRLPRIAIGKREPGPVFIRTEKSLHVDSSCDPWCFSCALGVTGNQLWLDMLPPHPWHTRHGAQLAPSADMGFVWYTAPALCDRLTAGACELDHVAPVRQAFAGSVQTLQALCGDCHSEKTLRESAQPTSLERRVAPGVMEQHARSPKLPPLIFEAQACKKDALHVGVDVVRCRRNGLANAPFPLPILRRRRRARGGVLSDLGFVEGCCDTMQSCLNLLPKVSLAATLDLGVCRWDHIVSGISGRGDAAARPGADGRGLARGRGAHGQAQRERDDRLVGAQHGGGLQRVQQQQAGRGGRGLLSGLRLGGHGVGLRLRPEAAEQRHLPPHPRRGPGLRALHGGQGPAHPGRAAALPRAGEDGLPADAAAAEALLGAAGGAAPPGRHAGLPGGRDEALLGSSKAPRMEAECPKQRRWNETDNPAQHCLAGNSLLLTGLPGTGKTHLARTIVARLREQGEAVHLVSKTHCSAQNLGWARRRPTTGCAGTCAAAARSGWTGWSWRRSRSWTWRSGRTWPAWS